jgi:hypothetical protein
MRRHGSYWNEPEASAGIAYRRAFHGMPQPVIRPVEPLPSLLMRFATSRLPTPAARGWNRTRGLGIRDPERPALLKISQQRAAGGCSSEVLERMPAQNGAR